MTTASQLIAASFDIDSLNGSAAMTTKVGLVFDDEGEPTVGFVIVGKDSDAYRAAERRLSTVNVVRHSTKSQRIDGKTLDGAATLVDLGDARITDLTASVVVDWFGFTRAGEPIAFSAEGLRNMFKVKPTWRDKIAAALENDDAFLPKSSPTSATSPDSSSV